MTDTSQHGGYAVIADGRTGPTAVFRNLEDAIQWAIARFGSDHFQIRWIGIVDCRDPEARGAS